VLKEDTCASVELVIEDKHVTVTRVQSYVFDPGRVLVSRFRKLQVLFMLESLGFYQQQCFRWTIDGVRSEIKNKFHSHILNEAVVTAAYFIFLRRISPDLFHMVQKCLG